MDLGAILLPASTAERHPAVLVGTPQRNTEIIAIPLAHGASTVIRSTDVQKPVRPVARLPMQEIVGGLITAIYPYEEPVGIVANDEGLLLGMDFNRTVEGGYCSISF